MKSLKAKLILRLLLGALLLLAVAGSVFHWRMKRALAAEFDGALRLTAQSLQVFIEEEKHELEMDSDVDDMQQFDRERGSAVFLLTQPDGKEIKRSKSLGDQTLPVKGGSWDDPAVFDAKLRDGRRLRCMGVFLEVEAHHDQRKTPKKSRALLVVGRDRTSMEKTLRGARDALLIAGAATLASLAGLVYWGVRKGLRPLDQLVGDLSRVDQESLATRFPVHPLPTELQPIALRLNELLERLESAFDREKRFTANVAHELRTPLAELRVLADMSVMIPATSAHEVAGRWEDVAAVTTRMESLALRLLELARSENPGKTIRLEPIRIASLLHSVWDRVSALAGAEETITLQADLPADLEIHADPVLMDMILVNLMGNAAQHAIPHSLFRIHAEGRAIHFINRADGLEKEDVPRLFERFWKKDASRTDGNRHGLGLALAAEAAALMGGSLDARLREEGGLEFVLVLP
jgi:signal transduction histidine kinase